MKPYHIVRSLAAGLLLAAAGCAHAVITFTSFTSGARSISLQVGSANNTVNTVTFDVLNANIAPTPTQVTGVPGNGAPATSPANGVLVVLSTRRRGTSPDVIKLTANSAGGLVCQSGVCASNPTPIPFNTVSWTSYEVGGGSFGGGIPSGTFNGSTSQTLFSFTIPAGSSTGMEARNVLVFSYNNTTLYPSGVYRGRVVYTATVP